MRSASIVSQVVNHVSTPENIGGESSRVFKYKMHWTFIDSCVIITHSIQSNAGDSLNMDMGVKEAARFCGVTEKTIYRWLSSGTIPFFRVGSQYRFNESDLTLWATSSGSAGAPAGPDSRDISVSRLLDCGGIHYRLEGHDVESSIRSIVKVARIEYIDEGSLVASLLEREAMASTAIGNGIALPHLRYPIPQIRRPLLVLGFLESKVDFRALDQCHVHALFLLLSPTAQEHLHILARLSHVLRDARLAVLIQKQGLRSSILKALDAIERELPDGPCDMNRIVRNRGKTQAVEQGEAS